MSELVYLPVPTFTFRIGEVFTINGVPLTVTPDGELTQEMSADELARAFNTPDEG